MANEKRLIDANIMPHGQFWEGLTDKEKAKVLAYLVMSPTVDAVEVVRCRDCWQWSRNVGVADSPNGHCFYHDIEMNGYDFCSCGERRDDG